MESAIGDVEADGRARVTLFGTVHVADGTPLSVKSLPIHLALDFLNATGPTRTGGKRVSLGSVEVIRIRTVTLTQTGALQPR